MKNKILPILLIIILPIVLLLALYFFVPPIQGIVNESLQYAPFGIGEYFKTADNDEKVATQISEIAAYLLAIDIDRAVDKLNVIKSEDESTYKAILNAMIRQSPHKADRIIVAFANQSNKDNAIANTLAQIAEESLEEAKEKAEYIEGLDALSAAAEIQRILDDEKNGHKQVAAIYNNLSDEKIITINTHLFHDDILDINSNMDASRVRRISALKDQLVVAEQKIKQVATVLSEKSVDELAALIGSEDTYSLSDLASIYKSLGPKRSGEVLAVIDNDAFTLDLTSTIAENARLKQVDDNFSKDLYKSLNIYSEYDDNLDELVKIYNNVDNIKVADIIRRLYWNTDNVKNYTLSNGEIISISDEKLALDLLQSFSDEKIASILSYLDSTVSTEISTKLALPDL